MRVIRKYGPIPALAGISAASLFARLAADKKTVQGKVHFVLPVKIGEVKIVSGVDDRAVMEAIEVALHHDAGDGHYARGDHQRTGGVALGARDVRPRRARATTC